MSDFINLQNIERIPDTVLTVGTFDGVHKGHRELIKTVVKQAKECGCRSVVVSFDPHPREIINPGASGIKLLTTLEERAKILEDIGINVLCVIPFDRDFSLLSSEEFIRDIIYKKIGVSEFVIGYDHQFGKDREGTIDTVKRLGEKLGFSARVVSRKDMGDTTISSTLIRKVLSEEGDVKKAGSYLGRNYRLQGIVTHGEGRGKKIGYPTANIRPSNEKKVIPNTGVYAVRVIIEEKQYRGMMNIGFRPTFEGKDKTLEVHLFNFDESIYGKKVDIEFVDRVRNEIKFEGIEQLVNQLRQDEANTKKILS